jgi:hypothetical protein
MDGKQGTRNEMKTLCGRRTSKSVLQSIAWGCFIQKGVSFDGPLEILLPGIERTSCTGRTGWAFCRYVYRLENPGSGTKGYGPECVGGGRAARGSASFAVRLHSLYTHRE